jgi:hypothetical protein
MPCVQGLFVIVVGIIFSLKMQEFPPAFIVAKVSGVAPIYVDYTYKGTEYNNIFLEEGYNVEDKQIGDSVDVVIDKREPDNCMYRGSYRNNSSMIVYVCAAVGIFYILIGVFEKYTMGIFGVMFEPYKIILRPILKKMRKNN